MTIVKIYLTTLNTESNIINVINKISSLDIWYAVKNDNLTVLVKNEMLLKKVCDIAKGVILDITNLSQPNYFGNGQVEYVECSKCGITIQVESGYDNNEIICNKCAEV